ncbi:MAG: PorT family protein [Haliscomenobacteraceae bacterium CHB4]|nr:PorT family protein [Haliscomenobacteraceae bacterium CHB4]
MKKTLLAVLVFWVKMSVAQEGFPPSFAWGFMAGFESQTLGIEPFATNDPEQMYAESRRTSHGGSVGVFGRWNIWKGLSVQPALSIASLQSEIQFSDDGNEKFQFTDLELPLHFVLTNPNGQFPLRGSILLGGRLGWNFAPQNSDNLQFLRERLGLDLGLGAEIRLKNWRVQPEFVYSHGINNLHDVVNAKYDWVVGRMVRDKLTFRVLVWMDKRQ